MRAAKAAEAGLVDAVIQGDLLEGATAFARSGAAAPLADLATAFSCSAQKPASGAATGRAETGAGKGWASACRA
ncbi:3-hydroxyacyl-CoA dehydrogenase, partial [Paracoccus sp. APAP_BH8]